MLGYSCIFYFFFFIYFFLIFFIGYILSFLHYFSVLLFIFYRHDFFFSSIHIYIFFRFIYFFFLISQHIYISLFFSLFAPKGSHITFPSCVCVPWSHPVWLCLASCTHPTPTRPRLLLGHGRRRAWACLFVTLSSIREHFVIHAIVASSKKLL